MNINIAIIEKFNADLSITTCYVTIAIPAVKFELPMLLMYGVCASMV